MIIRWPFRIAGVALAVLAIALWFAFLIDTLEPGPVERPSLDAALFAVTTPLFALFVGVPSVFGGFPGWFGRVTPEFVRSLLRANRESWLIEKFGWRGGYAYVFCFAPVAIAVVLAFGAMCAFYAWLAGAYWISLIWAVLTLFVIGAELNDLVKLFRAATVDRECATCTGES